MRHRYATREDLVRWFGNVPATMRALVIERDGELLGIAGITTANNHVQAFSSQKPELAPYKVAKGRMTVAFAKMLAEIKGPVFAVCSEVEPTAPGLLTHLGFRHQSERVWRHG